MADEQAKPVDSGLQQADIAAQTAAAKAEKAGVRAVATPAATPVTPAVTAPAASIGAEQPVGSQADPEDDGHSAGDDAGQPGGTNAGKANTPRGVQKRLDKLTREKYEAMQQAEYWRQQAQQRPQAQPAQAAQPAAQAHQDGKPTLEACGNDPETYLEALAEWKADQRWKERERQVAEQAKQQEAAKVRSSHLDREKAFAEAHPDYYDTAYTAPINYSPSMLEFITGSERGPEVAYYLAQHLDEAKTIESLPPLRQGIALDRIEQKVAATPAVSTEAPARQVTQAPQPPATVAPSGTARRNIYDDGLSTAERIAMWRRKKSA